MRLLFEAGKTLVRVARLTVIVLASAAPKLEPEVGVLAGTLLRVQWEDQVWVIPTLQAIS